MLGLLKQKKSLFVIRSLENYSSLAFIVITNHSQGLLVQVGGEPILKNDSGHPPTCSIIRSTLMTSQLARLYMKFFQHFATYAKSIYMQVQLDFIIQQTC